MKKLLYSVLIIFLTINIQAQTDKSEILRNLEQSQSANQDNTPTATTKSSTRLFGSKDDLTTVIFIIPSGSTVSVLGGDSTYFHVVSDETEGYIFRRHAILDKVPVIETQYRQQSNPLQEKQQTQYQQVQQQQVSRFSYLEEKYGSNMAARLMAGKIWKGMNSEMVKESWGTAQKVNRVVSGNTIKEEWIFRYTWLYFENNVLVEWGPIKN